MLPTLLAVTGLSDYPGVQALIIIIYYFLLAVALLTLYMTLRYSIVIVRHAEVMIIERLGKFNKVLKPGYHFLIPFIDQPRSIHRRSVLMGRGGDSVFSHPDRTDRVDLREHVVDFGRQQVITKDTVSMEIDALVYYQVTDPELAVFQIANVPDAIEFLTQTTLRHIISSLTLDDTFSSRDIINQRLRERTAADADRWGVTIRRIEIFNILPPRDVKEAMEAQIKEERGRRSTVLLADGQRESAIVNGRGQAASVVLRAEGYRVSRVQVAKGQAQAKLLQARAEADSIAALRSSLDGVSAVKPTEYLIALQYLRALAHLGVGEHTRVNLLPSSSTVRIGQLMKMNKQA